MKFGGRFEILGKFVSDSLLLWGSQMAGILISVMATVFVTRALGPEGRGVYTWLLTLAGIGSQFAMFGMDTANRRLAASEPERIPALLRMNLLVIAVFGAVVMVVLAGISLSSPMAGITPLILAMAVVTAPMNAVMMAASSLFVAMRKVGQAAWSGFLPKVLLAAGFGVLVWAGMVNVGWVLAANLLAAVFGTLLPLWLLRYYWRGGGELQFGPYIRTVWRMCSATYLAGLSYYMMQKVDVLMIGAYMGEAPTGYYGVASNIADLMIMPISIIAGMLAARIAAAHQEDKRTGLTRHVVLLTMGLAVMGCAFTYLIAGWLIRLLFGEAFEPAVLVLRLLCPAVVGLSFFMLMHNILMATGRARYLAIPALVGCGANVGLNMILIPSYGLVGACVASIVAYPLAGLVGAAILWRAKGIRS